MSLLEAFPAPPSHIPSAHNPPPSRPPSFPLPPLPSVFLSDTRRDSVASSSSGSTSSLAHRIRRQYPNPESLIHPAISPAPLLDDDYDLTTRHHSISEIDIRDLPAVDDDDDTHTSIPPFNAFRPLHKSLADPIDPRNIPFSHFPLKAPLTQEIHLEIRTARSKSSTHKTALRARSRSKSTPRSLPSVDPPRLTKNKSLPPSSFKQPESERSTSPDIDSIISLTPRPLRRQPSSYSDLSGNTLSRKCSLTSAVSARSRNSSVLSATSQSTPSMTTATLDDIVVRESATSETDLNSVDSDGLDLDENSDSSLDLHTPLPHLMVKHGLLSPHSKLLPQSEDRHLGQNRPDSILSTTTKSGIAKDERNTPMRKERHRDGKLLRGGLGLTTGLGWSDSEDEDAPSPFTRRLSHLTLSRQSSTASIQSYSKHPLSKSYSGHDENEESAMDEWGQSRPRTKTSARSVMPPPTSWHGRTGAGSRPSRGKTASSASFSSIKIKTTKSFPSPDSLRPTQSHNSSDDTPSSASSSLSMMLPLTPQDEVLLNAPAMTRKGGKLLYDKDKHLPPLPIQPILKKQPGQIGVPFPMTPARSRANSTAASTPMTPKPTAMTRPTTVRPLHLPQRVASVGDRPAVPVPALHQAASSSSLRPRQGFKSVPSSKSVPKLSASSVTGGGDGGIPSPVSTPNSLPKPKPRTGTGMTYRKSSSSRVGGGAAGEQGGKTSFGSSGIPQVSALNGLGIHTRSKTPVIPKASSTTVVGQAF